MSWSDVFYLLTELLGFGVIASDEFDSEEPFAVVALDELDPEEFLSLEYPDED